MDDTRVTISAGGASVETTVAALKNRHEEIRRQQGKPPMKPDPTFDKAADNSYRVTASELRGIVDQIEKIEAEQEELKDQKASEYAAAKARGYDTKALRAVIANRKKDKDQMAEHQAVVELYSEALGM
ncbi:GapR family DNA-binding domain-containing protein [Ruegeria sp. ANG-R]|uniref:DUF2312 domain-containing protein n=1 Tax=Ruegeria sp. ANG-R TaxID=1577903 RepID=UPI002678CAA3